MKEKKTRDANLDRLRTPLLLLGLLFASAIVLTAFEWKTYAEPPKLESEINWRDLPDEPIFTAVVMQKPPPPPPPPRPVVDVFVIVDEDRPIHDLEIPDIDLMDEPIIEDISTKREEILEETIEPYMMDSRYDAMPDFPGGDMARMEYLRQNVRYPIKAKKAGKQGTVWVEFVIGKDGEIEDAHILQGIDHECDEEALRVVRQMPVWTPGKQRGVPVRVRFKMPITYTLRSY